MITEASPILNLLLAKGVGTKTLSEIVDNIVARGLSLEDVGIDVLADALHWRAEIKDKVLAVQVQADKLAEELERQNVRILVRGFDPYPHKLVRILGKDAPPVLFVKGNLAILDAKAVGFCGSRHASQKGIQVAAQSARQLGENGVDIVSGYAKGVDLAAHCAGLAAGGTTTIVLAEGILHFRPKREIKGLLDDNNHLVVSEYSPRLPWAARHAMQRNRTIIGLSNAMIVIESGTTGGTHACAQAALRLGQPLFVAEYAVPAESAGGNQYFLERGAQPLRGDRLGRPNLTRVYQELGIETAEETNGENHAHEAKLPAHSDDSQKDSNAIVVHEPNAEPDENAVNPSAYPKRLIEVDLPIARISAHARREKSIRHGHISTLHIWWARRPLAACRAVVCAALWPDPADPLCPQAFRDAAVEQVRQFANRVFPRKITEEGRLLSSDKHLSQKSRDRWEAIAAGTLTLDSNEPADMPLLRTCLLDFIADFANWDNSTVPAYLETSRALTQAAHEALGGAPGTRPLVVDPFAGGGSIPLEALRVGADAFASDLNPIPVLLNKVVLEYIPKFGQQLADEVRKWGAWIKQRAEQELADFYQKDPDGATPIAYLWARTILSEAPGQGEVPVEVPLMRSLWLANKASRRRALRWVRDDEGQVQTETVEVAYVEDGQRVQKCVRRPLLEVFEPAREAEVDGGTVARGSATCPVTGYTTKVESVRAQLKARRGGAADARLFCVVTTRATEKGRFYRLPTQADQAAFGAAAEELERREQEDGTSRARKGRRENEGIEPGQGSRRSLVPDEAISPNELRRISVPIYGMERWGDLFSPRQALALATLARLVREVGGRLASSGDAGLAEAVQTCLSLTVGRQADILSSLARWHTTRDIVNATFGRQAIGMVWDFAEANFISGASGSFEGALEWVVKVIQANVTLGDHTGHVGQASATNHPLPDDSVAAFVTDPPYYDAVPYAYLSDFFYVWMRRTLADVHPALFREGGVPKDVEIVVDRPHQLSQSTKDIAFYERELTKAFAEGRRITRTEGVGTIVFASKTTASWEAILKAVVDAGWVITGSWPIDTEMETRVAAQGQARLASSVHLVTRPRQNPDGSLREEVGEWRDVLGELPKRIHEWMPRLAAEGVVGADAIFACLGPALEIFSRYSRVEKADGSPVPLRDYLVEVWAAVSTEALSMIFQDADAAGLEPDARLTAMWLWTLGGMETNGNGKGPHPGPLPGGEEESGKVVASTGYTLEFDAARKIAQGLGIHLEKSESIVEVKGDKARLLPASERTRYLFGKDDATAAPSRVRGKKKAEKQMSLFDQLDSIEADVESDRGKAGLKPSPGETVLDRVHQAMILFAAGRGEALRRFLVEDGAGTDARFWKLAQSLSALYPKETDEKRWVDGVLARKKGLGL